MARPNLDPIRRAWMQSDYAKVAALIDQGCAPEASTLRRIFAPQFFCARLATQSAWTGIRNAESPPDYFCSALFALTRSAPSVLKARPSMLGDMKANGSLRLLTARLSEGRSRISPSGFPDGAEIFEIQRAQSIMALLELDPLLTEKPIIETSWTLGTGRLALNDSELPLWTLCSEAPSSCIETFLARVDADKPTHRAWAWRAIEKSSRFPRWLDSHGPLAAFAQPPSDIALFKMCTHLALSAFDRRADSTRASRLPALMAHLIANAKIDPDRFDTGCLLGSRALLEQESKIRNPYSLLRPAPFDRAQLFTPKTDDPIRARQFLDWIESSVQLALELGFPPVADKLPNPRVEAAYLSLSRRPDLATVLARHPISLHAPSLSSAFNSRLLGLQLERQLPAGHAKTLKSI